MAEADAPSSVDDIPVPSADDMPELLEEDTGGEEQEEQPTRKRAKKQPAQAEDTSEEQDQADESDDEADNPADEDEGAEDSEESDEDSEEDDDTKARNREGYAQRARSQIRGNVTAALDKIAAPQTQADLEQQGMEPALAQVEALRQEMQRDKVIAYVTDLNAELNMDANNVVRDFAIYNEKSPEFDAEFAADVERRYKEASKLRTDPSGQFVTNAEIPLYDFYAWAAKLRGSGAKKAKVEGQRAAERMLAASETAPSSKPSKKSGSKEDDLFLRGLMGKGNHS